MHTTACTRQLVLVAMSAAIAGGFAVAPANAADTRMAQASTTVSSITDSLSLTMLDPPDRRRNRRHAADDDTPKMGACRHPGCEDKARQARRKAQKEFMRQWYERRDTAVSQRNWRNLKKELKGWIDFRSPGVKEREETLERIRESGRHQGDMQQGGMHQGGMQPHPGP
ncbi:hypothetical protein [Nonomuraea sp. B19D2]|uniref:hypothetical protein n=1 Tax=Nonomuraea sp. B19D2 TaxID=3159561 RepID=UPI0032DAA60A